MSPDPSESPRLKDHFLNPSLDDWEAKACRDLGIASLADAAWGPEGGPAIPPLTRTRSPISIQSRPGWRYAELVEAHSPSQAALGLNEASAGGADLGFVRCGPGGLPVRHLPDLTRSSPLPIAVSAGSVSQESAQILAEANCAGYLVDPFAGHLRGESDVDLPSLADSALLTTGRRCFSVDLRAWEEAGAPPVHLAALAFAAVADWMRALTDQGLGGSEAASRLTLIVPASQELFPTIGLIRAIRAGVERVLREFRATEAIPIVGVTAASAVEHRDPYTNLIRATTAAVASVIGGVDVLSVRPFDPVDADQSARGLRLARNIAHLLRHEGHLDKVADPAAGSFYAEALTRELGSAGWEIFADWETQGGLAAVVSRGVLVRQFGTLKAEREQRMKAGQIKRIGVNHYAEDGVSA